MLTFDFFRSAFYGRIEDSIAALPSPYHHNKPEIAFSSGFYNSYTKTEAFTYSFNWIESPIDPDLPQNCEQIVSQTGLAVNDMGKASRITKIELMKCFVDVKKSLSISNPNAAFYMTQTYNMMKVDAEDYNRAKEACIAAFRQKNLGDWRKVQKTSNIGEFALPPKD